MPRLIPDPVWSWPAVVLVSAVLLAVVLITYPPRVRHLPTNWRRTLIGMRLATALLLIIAMLRPALVFTETDKQAAVLIVLMDKSKSMSTPDGPGGVSRREALIKTLIEADEPLQKLGDSLEVRYLDFADELHPSPPPSTVGRISNPSAPSTPTDAPKSPPTPPLTTPPTLDPSSPFTADGPFTAIGKIIDELRQDDPGKRLVGVVLMSDGAQRASGDDDVDARSAARKFAEQRGVPIHTVIYGTSELSGAGLDLAVEDVLTQPVTFEKKTVPVKAQVRLLGAAGRKVRVRLLIEDRAGKRPGESGEMKELPLSREAKPFIDLETKDAAAVVPVELSFVADLAGEFKIAIEAVPLDDELKKNNNRLETLITVRKGGLKVAYFDIFRPEQQKIRELNRTAEIQLDWQVVLSGPLQPRTKIDPALFEPGAYDVYIIGDVPASVFPRVILERLADRVEEGAGLAMTGGLHNFGSGGYAETRLADFLPVRMTPAETLNLTERIPPERHHRRKLQMVPTDDGLQHYLMQLAPRDNERLWRSLPPLGGAVNLQEKNDAVDVFAASTDGVPLLFAIDTGRARVIAFAADDTYRWYLHGEKDVHQRFWQQLILWLARKEDASDAPVWVKIDPRNFAPTGRVPITFGARDTEGDPITDAEFKLDVLRPDGERKPVTVQRAGEEGFAEFTETDLPGDYWVTVLGTRGGDALALPAQARFIVDPRDLEMDNPAADPDLMAEIAAITGAVPLPAEQFAPFITGLVEQGISTEITRQSQINLWDNWPLLLAFVLLLGTEWFVRKRRGLV